MVAPDDYLEQKKSISEDRHMRSLAEEEQEKREEEEEVKGPDIEVENLDQSVVSYENVKKARQIIE